MSRTLSVIIFFNVISIAGSSYGSLKPATDVTAKDKPDDGGGAIQVSWERSSSDDVVKYEIIRISKSGEEVVVGEKTRIDSAFLDESSDEAPLEDDIPFAYLLRAFDSKGAHVDSKPSEFVQSKAAWFHSGRLANLLGVIIFSSLFFLIILRGGKGKSLYIRPISALDAIDDAVGRAAEMGRPLLYVPGLGDVAHPCTVASMGILSKVGEKAVRLWTKVKVPNYSPLVWPVSQNVLKQAYIKAGRPDMYTPDDVPYFTSRFLTFATAVAGIMTREKTASNFLIGHFYSEALILAETGAATGAVQIGGTDSEAQLPFFVTTCDHTMIGEEVFAAAALVSEDAISKSSIKATDWFKVLAVLLIIFALALSIAATAGSDSAAELFNLLLKHLKGSS